MKANNLTELTLEELYKRKKTLAGITIGFTLVMIIACSFFVYLSFKSQKFTLIAIIPAFLIMLLPGMINLGKVNSEIKARLI